eukprot:TRINITY_DN4892_c0_g1_i2.p1 TRINITY_DN4892_c0_g1~~TRINITY_DN4892_c0_g1_i2.p1  ORF type:complete len:168 (+),score=18.60 TRINITY_DN4892_c0_g1_i2:103-606(+)
MPPRRAPIGDKRQEEEMRVEALKDLDDLGLRKDAVERMLVIRSEQTARSRYERDMLKKELVELDAKLNEETKLLDSTSVDMYRHYRAMQSDLVDRIAQNQRDVAALRQKLAESRAEVEAILEEKEQVIAQKNRKLNEQKQRMEDMAIEFGESLKETLDQMAHRIDRS